MGPTAEKWLQSFEARQLIYEEAAHLARDLVHEAISTRDVGIHSVTHRVKSVASAREKIERKAYGRPATQMTDVIGLRVITSYRRGVEEVASRLRAKFSMDEENSVDKREFLGVEAFGYRGVHLILKLGRADLSTPSASLLEATKVEVQVRSIVEHAWAEIEHELRYKSGVDLPREVRRRFASVAGALDLVDREFDSLANSLSSLVETYSERYRQGQGLEDAFDSARLIGFMVVKRQAAHHIDAQDLPLSFSSAAECVRALTEVQMNAGKDLIGVMDNQSFLGAVRAYADARSVEPEEVSIPAVVAIIVGLKKPAVLDEYPLLNDSLIRGYFENSG